MPGIKAVVMQGHYSVLSKRTLCLNIKNVCQELKHFTYFRIKDLNFDNACNTNFTPKLNPSI